MDLNQTPDIFPPLNPDSSICEMSSIDIPPLFASTSSPVCSSLQPSSTSASHRRTLRPRAEACGSSLLHGINRRTISRPRKLSSHNPSDISEKDIIKLYLNKKLPRVKPTSLETIFEEPEDGSEIANETSFHALETQCKLIGSRKLKRSLSFSSDHARPNKATILKRRRRIKDRLGVTKKTTKFSMQLFIEKMEALQSIEAKDDPDSA